MTAVPFEPLDEVSPKMISLKSALSLAITLAKRVRDLTAPSVNLNCLQIAEGDSKGNLSSQSV